MIITPYTQWPLVTIYWATNKNNEIYYYFDMEALSDGSFPCFSKRWASFVPSLLPMFEDRTEAHGWMVYKLNPEFPAPISCWIYMNHLDEVCCYSFSGFILNLEMVINWIWSTKQRIFKNINRLDGGMTKEEDDKKKDF